MKVTEPKITLHFGLDYWLCKLIEIGKKSEPDKYTADYVELMRSRWGKVGLSFLVMRVFEKQSQLKSEI